MGQSGETVEESVEIVMDFLEKNDIVRSVLPVPQELFVPASLVAEKQALAATLPRIDIDEVSLQWVCASHCLL